MTVAIIVPCYNEADSVAEFYRILLRDCIMREPEVEFITIFIDDGSTDNTFIELKQLMQTNPRQNIHLMRFSRNFGKEAAMYAGLESALDFISAEDYAVIIDADLQQPPRLICKMLQQAKQDSQIDCVCCYQKERRENKIVAFLKRQFYRVISHLAHIDFVNGASDFRLFRGYVVQAIISMTERNRFSKGIFNWVGFRTKYLPYTPDARRHGQSKFGLFSLIKYALSGIIAFSTAPLRFATYTGFICSVLSFIYLVVVVIQKFFFTIEVPGYATIVAILLLIGGLILFCLGIVGEYIAKIFTEVKARPLYIVRSRETQYHGSGKRGGDGAK